MLYCEISVGALFFQIKQFILQSIICIKCAEMFGFLFDHQFKIQRYSEEQKIFTLETLEPDMDWHVCLFLNHLQMIKIAANSRSVQ